MKALKRIAACLCIMMVVWSNAVTAFCVNESTIKDSFLSVLQKYDDSYYTIYDIDKDGIPELIIDNYEAHGGQSNRTIQIYLYDNGAVFKGEFGGYHATMYPFDEGNGMFIQHVFMGTEDTTIVSIENGECVEKSFCSGWLSDPSNPKEPTDLGAPFQWANVQDTSLVDSMMVDAYKTVTGILENYLSDPLTDEIKALIINGQQYPVTSVLLNTSIKSALNSIVTVTLKNGIVVSFTGGNINYTGIVVYATERSLSVSKNETLWLGFSLMKGGRIVEDWSSMSIANSDPTVLSLSEPRKEEYGYSLQTTGLSTGVTNLVISDTQSGLNTTVQVHVYDRFSRTLSYYIESMPVFYPNNKYEAELKTNIYDLNGVYINNYAAHLFDGSYKVSFDAYNTRYHNASVDIYDKDGVWLESKCIKKTSEVSSLKDTAKQAFYLLEDFVTEKMLTYEQASYSEQSKVSFEVPIGGYFTISNNPIQSIGCFFYNGLEILYEGTANVIESKISKDPVKVWAFSDLMMKEITESPSLREAIQESFKKTLADELEKYLKNVLTGVVDDALSPWCGLLNNLFCSLDIQWEHAFEVVSGFGESVFEELAGPAGLALKGCFAMSDSVSLLLQAVQLAKSCNQIYATVYSDKSIEINPYGVSIIKNGNIDNEATLQVFKLVDNQKVADLVDAHDESYELYNIAFVKNDAQIQPAGLVEVRIPIPDGFKSEECNVYRQESDGAWTKLDVQVKDHCLVFYTDHFSFYAVVGKLSALSIARFPDKLVYTKGETVDATGMSLYLNNQQIQDGFILDPCVAYAIGTQIVTVKYAGLEIPFTIQVEDIPHVHTYTSIVTVEPTCVETGVMAYTCIDGDHTYTESIPATGNHVDDDNSGHCDTCKQQMTGGDHCNFCGKIHNGAFGWLVKFFHSIFAIFKR